MRFCKTKLSQIKQFGVYCGSYLDFDRLFFCRLDQETGDSLLSWNLSFSPGQLAPTRHVLWFLGAGVTCKVDKRFPWHRQYVWNIISKGLVAWCHSFCLFWFYNIHTFIQSQYIPPSPFAEAFLHILIACVLSGEIFPVVPRRESNSGLPYSKPTRCQLGHAAPFISDRYCKNIK